MNLKDTTFVICSYEQKEVLEYCLKSIVYNYQEEKPKLLIVENSKSDDIRDFLSSNNIPFWKNDKVSTTHSPSLSYTLSELVKTKYAIIMDSDALMMKPIDRLFQLMLDNNLDMLGEHQGSRGGYQLHPRIAPYFCIVNIENFNKNNVKFHDQVRIDKTNSNGFFGHVPIQVNKNEEYYDVGSTFLEDALDANLRVAGIAGINEYIKHYEGMSWRTKSGISEYEIWGQKILEKYKEDVKKFEDIDLKNRFEPYE